MKTTVEFLDAIKARYNLPSDYALAPYLGVTRSSVSRLRNKQDFLGDSTALRVAELLDLDPGVVAAAAHAERARQPAEKAMWEDVWKKLGGLAATVAIGVGLVGAPSPTQASESSEVSANPLICIMLH